MCHQPSWPCSPSLCLHPSMELCQVVFVSTEAPAASGLQEKWWWLPGDVLRPRAVCESPGVKAHQDWLPCRAGESRTRAVTAVFHGGGVTGFVLHVHTAGEEID